MCYNCLNQITVLSTIVDVVVNLTLGIQAYDEVFLAMDNFPDDEYVQVAAVAAMKYLTCGEITGNDGSVAGDDVILSLAVLVMTIVVPCLHCCAHGHGKGVFACGAILVFCCTSDKLSVTSCVKRLPHVPLFRAQNISTWKQGIFSTTWCLPRPDICHGAGDYNVNCISCEGCECCPL